MLPLCLPALKHHLVMTLQSQALLLFQTTKLPRCTEKLLGLEIVHVALNGPRIIWEQEGLCQKPT